MPGLEQDFPTLASLCINTICDNSYWSWQKRGIEALPSEIANQLVQKLLSAYKLSPNQLFIFRHSLTSLTLKQPRLRAWIPFIADVPHLEYLHVVSRDQKTPEVIPERYFFRLSSLQSLKTIIISHVHFPNDTLSSCILYPNRSTLQHLSLSYTTSSRPVGAALAACRPQSLRHLKLQGLKMDRHDMILLSKTFSSHTELESLFLRDIDGIDDASIRELGQLTCLKSLRLSDRFKKVHCPPFIPSLTTLTLEYIPLDVVDEDTEIIWLHGGIGSFPELRYLRLHHVEMLNTRQQMQLFQSIVHNAPLKTLVLLHCSMQDLCASVQAALLGSVSREINVQVHIKCSRRTDGQKRYHPMSNIVGIAMADNTSSPCIDRQNDEVENLRRFCHAAVAHNTVSHPVSDDTNHGVDHAQTDRPRTSNGDGQQQRHECEWKWFYRKDESLLPTSIRISITPSDDALCQKFYNDDGEDDNDGDDVYRVYSPRQGDARFVESYVSAPSKDHLSLFDERYKYSSESLCAMRDAMEGDITCKFRENIRDAMMKMDVVSLMSDSHGGSDEM